MNAVLLLNAHLVSLFNDHNYNQIKKLSAVVLLVWIKYRLRPPLLFALPRSQMISTLSLKLCRAHSNPSPRGPSCLRLRGEKERRVLPAVQLTFVTCPATRSCQQMCKKPSHLPQRKAVFVRQCLFLHVVVVQTIVVEDYYLYSSE